MADSTQKTFIASTLFLDIIAYSERPVAQQLDWKDHFNDVLAQAMGHVNKQARIVLDTGDGAAICFLDDPEEALEVAISFLQGFLCREDGQRTEYQVRMGINLGPVKIVRDLNDQRNIIGDGVNVAQRVMSFAGPNRVFVSRSFFDVVAYLTRRKREIFRFEGIHKDKHGREHEVYEVMLQGVTTPAEETCPVDLTTIRDGSPAPESTPAAPDILTGETLKKLEKHYAHYVGPIANTLLKRASSKAVSAIDFCDRLCAAITDPADKEAFAHHFQSQVSTGQETTEPQSHAPTAPADTNGEKPTRPTVLAADVMQTAERELARLIGPIAKVLVAREAKKSKNLEEFCQALADKIDDAQQRRQFLETLKRG